MPTITINGRKCEFKAGQMILQVANDHGIEIPQYCYHDGLSIVASCRICLVEVWAPNPRNDNKLEPIPKLLPSCQTPAGDGQVVLADSPKAVQNQKAVMEYLLINHPLDCPVCDQSGECFLQDYSFKYGRGVSRFEEEKVKQPKKDLGPHVYLYSDRCIMCSRCVRFTREVTGTAELMISARGNKSQIDVFPGKAVDNPLSANVNDLCPVGALLDKDFLFTQRVWFLKGAASIDGVTASGDNIRIDHNEGKIYRIKPRTNLDVNKWWITDEVRYGWKHVHSPSRLRSPMSRQYGALVECDWARAYDAALTGVGAALERTRRLAVMVSPMLSCEEAYLLAKAARAIDDRAILGVGPVPRQGEDQVFPVGAKRDDPKAFIVRAEKAPNARGVRRVLEAVAGGPGSGDGRVLAYDEMLSLLRSAAASSKDAAGQGRIGALILTGNYPSEWAVDELRQAAAADSVFTVLIDTLASALVECADVVLPGATWTEKAGTFENDRHRIQAFEQAIPVIEVAKSEGQISLDLLHAAAEGPVGVGATAGARSGAAGAAGASPRRTSPARGAGASDVHSPASQEYGGGLEDAQAARDSSTQFPTGEGFASRRQEAGSGERDERRFPWSPGARRAPLYNAGNVRTEMAAEYAALGVFTTDVHHPAPESMQEADMEVVEL